MKNDDILQTISGIADELEHFTPDEYTVHSSCSKLELLKWLYTGTRLSIGGEYDLVFVAGSEAMTGTKNQMLAHQFTDLSFLLWCVIEDMDPLHDEDRQVFEYIIR